MSGLNCFNFCHNNTHGGSIYISGTTCDGVVAAFTLTFGECLCLDIDQPYITCDGPIFSGSCIADSLVCGGRVSSAGCGDIMTGETWNIVYQTQDNLINIPFGGVDDDVVGCISNLNYPTSGRTYSFSIKKPLPSNWEIYDCFGFGWTYDRMDYVLGAEVLPNEWITDVNFYYNNVLVHTEPAFGNTILSLPYVAAYCNITDITFPFFEGPTFQVRQLLTPTPTNTQTPTQTPTVTQTPTNTGTQTPTPTNTGTPTQTPSPTPCVSECCFDVSGSTAWQGTSSITEIDFFDQNNLFIGIQQKGTFEGVQLQFTNKFSACGDGSNVVGLQSQCSTPGSGIPLGIAMAQQSTGKFVITNGTSIFRVNTDYTIDTSFNSMILPSLPVNQVMITGLYVGDSDKIYAVGPMPSGLTECTGTTYTFNQNIYRLNADGGIDTTYSGITLNGALLPVFEPRLTTEEDPNGKCLILTQTAFTGDTAYKNVMRLNPDGTPDNTFNNDAFSALTGNQIFGAFCQQDGKYMVFGLFTNLTGLANQDYLVRLNSDGTLDTTFSYNWTSTGVVDCEQDIRGNYHVISSNGRYFKLNSTGSIIFQFIPTTGLARCVGTIGCSVYLGGNTAFTISSGGTYTNLLKFDLDGNLNMCPYPSATPTQTPTNTQTPSITPTNTASATPTSTPTETPTNTPSGTPSITPSETPTSTPTETPPITPTSTIGTTPTPTPSITASQTPTMTQTPSSTATNNCLCYLFFNEDSIQSSIFYTPCGGSSTSEVLNAGQSVQRCIDPIAETPSYTGGVTTIVPCTSATTCNDDTDCTSCT